MLASRRRPAAFGSAGAGARGRSRRRLAVSIIALGTLSPLAAATVASAAPPWLAPVELAAPTTTFGGANVTGMADDGTAVVAFVRRGATVDQVFATVRSPGGTFSAPVPVSDETSAAYSLALAVDPQGNATAVWQQAGVVFAVYRPAGGTWGPPQPLSGTDGTTPTVSAGPGGGAAVGWWSGNTVASQRARVAVRAPGAATFSAATSASSTSGTTGSGVFTPRTAMDAAGNVAAVWTRAVDVAGTTRLVVESAIKPAGTPAFSGTAENRSSTTTGNASTDPRVVMAPDGRAFATWSFDDGVNASRIESATRAPGGSFPSASVVSTGSVDAYAPTPAIDDAGTVALTWSAGNVVQSAVRVPGGAFSAAKALSGPGASSFAATLDMAPSGEAVVAWPTGAGTDYAVYAARRRPGGDAFGEVTEVARGQAAAPPTSLSAPAVALDGEGNGFLAVRRSAGSPTTYAPLAVGYDVVAPTLTGVTAPASVAAGVPVGLGASATDRMSGPAFAWDFGDGTTAAGASPTHTWASPGVYTVTVRATDDAGNASQATRTVQASAPTGGGGGTPSPGGGGGTPGGGTTGGGTTTPKPATLKAPRITRPKRLEVGAKLSVPATLKGATKLRFQWLRDGKAVKKATKRTYRLVRKDRGHRIACRLTVSAGGRTVRLTTASVKVPRR